MCLCSTVLTFIECQVETDHMTIKNSPLMRQIVLLGLCMMQLVFRFFLGAMRLPL